MIPKTFKEHELWEILDKISETIQTLPLISYQTEENKRTINNRLPLYISTVKRHKNNAADFYSVNLLNNMKAQWESVSSRLYYLENSPSIARDIDNDLDRIAENLAKWPTIINLRGSAASNAVSIFEEAQSSFSKRIEHLEQVIIEKDKELVDGESRYLEFRTETNSLIDELHSRLDENEKLINTQNEKIAQQAVEHSEHFEAAQDERRKEYRSWMAEQEQTIDNEIESIVSSLGDKLVEGDQQLQKINELHENVEKAAHGATAAFLARDYNTASKRDYTAGILFMGLGVALLIAAGLVLYGSFASIAPDTKITWQWTALKVSATLLITAGATFAFKYSQTFLANASRFKRADLELRAINPFLANIGKKDLADQTKIDFINRSFGQSDSGNTHEKKEETDKNTEVKISSKELLETVIMTLKNNNN